MLGTQYHVIYYPCPYSVFTLCMIGFRSQFKLKLTSNYVDDLEFLTPLPLPPKCWDYRIFTAHLDQTKGFMNARQQLYQLNYIPSHMYMSIYRVCVTVHTWMCGSKKTAFRTCFSLPCVRSRGNSHFSKFWWLDKSQFLSTKRAFFITTGRWNRNKWYPCRLISIQNTCWPSGSRSITGTAYIFQSPWQQLVSPPPLLWAFPAHGLPPPSYSFSL